MMVAVGIVAVLRYSGVRLPQLPLPKFLPRWVRFGRQVAFSWRPLPRALSIGLLTAFLPCGWLYAFAIVAAGTSSLLWGAAVMAAFWLGTVPILVSVGTAVQTFSGTLGRRIPLATAILIVVLGLGTIAERFVLSGETLAPSRSVVPGGDMQEQLQEIQDSTPPCCRHQAS